GAEQQPVAEGLPHLTDHVEGAGHGHGDLDDAYAAVGEGAGDLDELLGVRRADHGDDAAVEDLAQLRFLAHGSGMHHGGTERATRINNNGSPGARLPALDPPD